MDSNTSYRLDLAAFARLLELLQADGYTCVGPTRADDAIVYDTIKGLDDLPRGWTDVRRRPLPARTPWRRGAVRYNVGPQSWKKYLFPPAERVWITHDGHAFVPVGAPPALPRLAFIGVRGCGLAALGIRTACSAAVRSGQRLSRPPRGVRHRRQLHRSRRHLLLRVHGDRPGGRSCTRPRPDRSADPEPP